MTTHTDHPDSHEFGLADGCPRCAEHAEQPERGMDKENARRIWFGDVYSETDRVARARMQDIAEKGAWLAWVIKG